MRVAAAQQHRRRIQAARRRRPPEHEDAGNRRQRIAFVRSISTSRARPERIGRGCRELTGEQEFSGGGGGGTRRTRSALPVACSLIRSRGLDIHETPSSSPPVGQVECGGGGMSPAERVACPFCLAPSGASRAIISRCVRAFASALASALTSVCVRCLYKHNWLLLSATNERTNERTNARTKLVPPPGGQCQPARRSCAPAENLCQSSAHWRCGR